MDKELLKQYFNIVSALEDTMRFILQSNADNSAWKFSSYKSFMRKYNEILDNVIIELPDCQICDKYLLDKVPEWADTLADQQKNFFHLTLANITLLKTLIANKIDIIGNEITNLKNFISANLRKAILRTPDNEIDIQDTIEQLLIGKS